MTYRFKLDEGVEAGFRRIGGEQISRIERVLGATEGGSAVHEARKSLKRIRALLRLARPGLGERVFERENARFRDIAALLAEARDQLVVVETADRLVRSVAPGARKAVSALRDEIGRHVAPPAASVATGEAVRRVRQAGKLFQGLTLGSGGFALLAEGLERSYRAGRRAFDGAYDRPSDEAFHRVRKGVQRHWRQMLLLSRAWPGWTAARAAEARELSRILGEDHDIAVLSALAPRTLGRDHARIVQRVCRERQTALRASARPLGKRLFAEKPARLRKAFASYWKVSGEIAHDDGLVPVSSRDRPRASGRKKRV